MESRSAKYFSLAEANELVPQITDATAEVIARLEKIRRQYKINELPESSVPGAALKDVEQALQGWSETILSLGGNPKGYFTVDFRSTDPELLYCWTYGEERISHIHKAWENFAHRRPLSDGFEPSSAGTKWVH